MAEQFGPQRLEAACGRALEHDSPHYRTVKTILARRFDRSPSSPSSVEATAYLGEARFARDASSLFPSIHPQPEGEPA